jgi:hypothetical protein
VSYVTFPWLERAGRLGNQLHQIAATIGIARDNGLEPLFPTSWSYRPYFSLPDSMYGDVPYPHDRPAVDFVGHWDERTRIYLQDLALWERHTDEVLTVLAPSVAAAEVVDRHWAMIPSLRPTVSIHVRRGDNVHSPDHYPMPSLDYYLAGAAAFPDHHVCMFSDDPEWCDLVLRPALAPRPASLFHGKPRPKEHEPSYMTAPVVDWADLFLMARCDAHVLSNSTMGMWAAMLARDETAIAPWPFFGPAIPYADAALIYRPGWRRLDARTGAPLEEATC